MSNRAVEIAVGLFVLLGIVSLMVLAIKISGLSNIYDGNNGYKITADFENIGGLKTRARVTIGGVQVGRVTDIKLNREDLDEGSVFRSRVTFSLNKNVILPQDSQAQILTSGLLGDNYIGLQPGFGHDLIESNGHIPLENTQSAMVLEELISSFISSKASGM